MTVSQVRRQFHKPQAQARGSSHPSRALRACVKRLATGSDFPKRSFSLTVTLEHQRMEVINRNAAAKESIHCGRFPGAGVVRDRYASTVACVGQRTRLIVLLSSEDRLKPVLQPIPLRGNPGLWNTTLSG